MEFPKEQIEDLKRYCASLSSLTEGGTTFFCLEKLPLPVGCSPAACDALLCPTSRDNYPSRLFLSVQVESPYSRNWNVTGARIGERNWFAFSWKVELPGATLVQLLLAHLAGFTKPK
jgi:hypothetical protein